MLFRPVLREGRLRMLDDRLLRGLLRPKRDELTED
jgi:hypothetical protein